MSEDKFVPNPDKYKMLGKSICDSEIYDSLRMVLGDKAKAEFATILVAENYLKVYGSEYLEYDPFLQLVSEAMQFAEEAFNHYSRDRSSSSKGTEVTSLPEEETAVAAWQKKHAHMSEETMREKWYKDGYKNGFETAENEAKVKQQPHLQAMYQSGWLEGRAALRREDKERIDNIIIKQVEAHRTTQQAYIENLLKEKANKNYGPMVIDTEEKLIQHFGQAPTANNSLMDAIQAKWEPIINQDYADMKFNIERVEVNSETRELKDGPILDASKFKVSPGVTIREYD